MLDIDRLFQPLLDLFHATNFQLFLLVGSGILAVSLLLLAMTHWGQSRPVWKCVLLSFAAHILLMGYAYGTRMLAPAPTVAEQSEFETDEILNISLMEDIGLEEISVPDPLVGRRDKIASALEPTHSIAAMPNLDIPSIAPLARAAVDSEIIIETDDDPAPEPTDDLSIPDSSFPVPVIADDKPRETEFVPDAETGFESDLAMLPEAKIIAPETIDIQRSQKASPEVVADEVDFDSELARAKPDDATDPMAAISESQSLLPPEPFSAEISARLPAPASAPEIQELASLKNLPSLKKLPKRNNSFRTVSRNRRIGDGQPVPRIYSLRNSESRLEVARQRGGSIQTEQAVDKALQWLAENQDSSGRWDPQLHGAGREGRVYGHNREGAGANADTGITALASLSFLGAGNTHLQGEYAPVLEKSIAYLISKQKANGDLSGEAKLFARMYCHSMSLLALSEALAVTGDQRLLNAVQKGVDYSVAAQNKSDGGWRYQPGDSGDMSQFGWQVLALHSAELGGARVPGRTFTQMKSFLKSCSSGIDGGLASYRPGQRPSATMTAEALLCRYFLHQQVSSSALIEAKRMVTRQMPNRKHVNMYYWYYGTLALYHTGGEDWQAWNQSMKETLLSMQHQTGDDSGSWPADGMWGGYGGKVYSTATAALNLEVYYRYSPVQQELAKTRLREMR
jgi:hypothetical protein